MAPIWKPLTIETYKDWVKAILDEASDNLSDWESSFIESIDARLNMDMNLTENQANKLESIYADKTK